MNRIVIATDGSANAWTAVEEGLELAAEVGAEVTFVTVRHGIPLLGEPVYQRHLTEQLGHARETLDRAEAEAARRGVSLRHRDPRGRPRERASSTPPGIATPTSSSSARAATGSLASALIGSVSRAVMSHSPVPVMIVRDRAHDRSPA